MKNKARTLITLLLAVSVLFSLTACGEVQKAENTVNGMLSAFKNMDFETVKMYMNTEDIDDNDTSNEALDTEYISTPLAENFEYRIISSEKTDDSNVIVKTEITTIDMKPVMSDFLVNAIQYSFAMAFSDSQPSEEEQNQKMAEMFSESVENAEAGTVTNEVDIKVAKNEDNEWKIQAEDDLLNALLGGLLNVVEEMENALNE